MRQELSLIKKSPRNSGSNTVHSTQSNRLGEYITLNRIGGMSEVAALDADVKLSVEPTGSISKPRLIVQKSDESSRAEGSLLKRQRCEYTY